MRLRTYILSDLFQRFVLFNVVVQLAMAKACLKTTVLIAGITGFYTRSKVLLATSDLFSQEPLCIPLG